MIDLSLRCNSVWCRQLSGFFGMLAATATVIPSPVASHENDPDNSNEIVVTSRKVDLLSESEIKDVASEFVDTLTVVSRGQGLPRYQPEVYCPAVIGMSEAVNSQIEARMKQVAQAAEVKPAGISCRTSALVIFVDDKKTFLDAFREAYPVYFRSLKDRHWKLQDEEGPAIAWHLAQLLDEQGNPIQRDQNGVAWVSSYTHASRMRTMTRSVMAMSVTIVERDALIGLTATQIGDYAFMRSMSDASPASLERTTAPTILTVLSTEMGEAAPASLTDWDLAYVKARYEGDWGAEGHKSGVEIRTAVQKTATSRGNDASSDWAE